MNKWLTKANLAQAIYTERQNLDRLLEQHLATAAEAPVMDNGWTARDIVGHVTQWEECLCDWVSAIQRGETPERPAPGYTWDMLDEFNEDAHRERQDFSLEDLQAAYRASGVAIFSALAKLTDKDLNVPYFDDTGVELWRAVAANTFQHYREHCEHIRAWAAHAASAQPARRKPAHSQ